jgi:hypothetical protein
MSPAKRLRVGLAGAGWVSRNHLAGWETLSDFAAIVAITDLDIERARAVAAEFQSLLCTTMLVQWWQTNNSMRSISPPRVPRTWNWCVSLRPTG